MASNFEQMSNDELRHQMETFGLPKVPITASTRNILIKRLQNHVKGSSSPAKATNKSRRETIHVPKYSSDDDSDRDAAKEKLKKKMENHKNARRQTIGGAGTSPAPPPPLPAAVEKPGRKSMRATPTKTTRIPEITPQRITKTIPVLIEDSDDEEDMPLVKPAPPPPAVPLSRRSKSKTPTLGKSDLVTTSYKQVVDTVHEDREEQQDDEDMEIGEQSDLEEEVPLATRYGSGRRSYDEVPEPALRPMSVRISPLRRTTLAGGSFRYEPSPVSKPEGFSHSYSRPSIATTSYTSSSYGSKYSASKKTDDEPEIQMEEFPYLREFSKRLSTLKAEAPLYKRTTSGSAPLTTSSSRTTTTSYMSSRTGNYRPTTEQESRIWDPVMRFFAQMERKYALKQKVLILLIILFVIFVLVMFWN